MLKENSKNAWCFGLNVKSIPHRPMCLNLVSLFWEVVELVGVRQG